MRPRRSRSGRPRRPRRRASASVVVVALLAAACGTDGAVDETVDGDGAGPAADAGPVVVATTSILGDVVGEVVGDDGQVEVLMGPGVDPHGYQASAAEAARLREADLVVAVGLQLEEQLDAALAAAEQDGARVLALGEHLDPLPAGAATHDDEHDHAADEPEHADDEHDHAADDGHAHGPEDPHVWLDPVRMADGVRLLASELAAVDDRLDDAEWARRGDDYAGQLLAVHAELEERFDAIPPSRRQLVTNHDALGYLADRYGFEVLGTVVPGTSTQAEADARRFAALIGTIEEAQVTALFAEHTDTTVLAEQLQREVQERSGLELEVVQLHTGALGGPGSGAETYLDLLRSNGERIAAALT